MTVRDYHRIVNGYGETVSQSLTINPRDYVSLNFTKTVLGIILSVNPADNEANRSSYQSEDRRGYMHTCTVLVVEDGRSSHFTLGNVIITPDSRTGLDDYYERLPNGCSSQITGQPWNNEINNIDPYKLDGDWCVVGFLGGSLDTPYILRWWPHPGNRFDPATSEQSNPNDTRRQPYLKQDGRFFHRINGVEFVVSKQGHVYLSTYRANSSLVFGTPLTPQEGRFPRTVNADEGGSFKAWIKPSQSFELDWNVPTNGIGVLDEPDAELPQTNPAVVGVPPEKVSTYVLADKDRFQIEVPETFEVISKKTILLTSEEDTRLTIKQSLHIDTQQYIDIYAAQYVDLSAENVAINSSNRTSLTSNSSTIVGGGRDLRCAGGNATIDLAGDSVTIRPNVASSGITITPATVLLNSGSLGGVVAGIPLQAAFATYLSAITAAQPLAATGPAYAAAITAATAALVSQLATAVSTRTFTG